MLTQVRDALSELGTATVGQLAVEIGTDRESVDAALAYWVNRGDVRARLLTVACGETCGKCAPADSPANAMVPHRPGHDTGTGMAYEWLGRVERAR